MKLLQNKKFIALYTFVIFIIIVFFYLYATASVNIYPTQGWQVSVAEEQGMQSQMLADMMEHIKKNNFSIDSIIFVWLGK